MGEDVKTKLPLQVNLFSVPDGFATVTSSSQVFADAIKLLVRGYGPKSAVLIFDKAGWK